MKQLFLFFYLFSAFAFAKNDWRPGIGLGYSPNYLVTLSGHGVSTGVPYSVSYNFEYEAGINLHLDYWSLNRNSWGVLSGLQIDLPRKLSKLMIDGFIFPVSGNTSKYQTNFIYFGTAYRWDIFYIPLAVTYGMTQFTPASGSTTTSSTENGFGALLGFGWFVEDDFVIEYIGRSTTTTLKFARGADSESTSGIISTAVLNVKYFF